MEDGEAGLKMMIPVDTELAARALQKFGGRNYGEMAEAALSEYLGREAEAAKPSDPGWLRDMLPDCREELGRLAAAFPRMSVRELIKMALSNLEGGRPPGDAPRPYEGCGGTDLVALCAMVNEKIALGYEPHGPVFDAGSHFVQMMLVPAGRRGG